MLRPYKQSERDHIDRMVKAAMMALKLAGLVYMNYEITEDHSGEPCINFYVTVEDSVIKRGKQSNFEIYQQMEKAVRAIVEPEEYGLQAYFSVRLKSEHALYPNDRRWALEEAS